MGNRVRQNIDAAVNRDVHTIDILGMREYWQVVPMRLLNRGPRNRQWQDCNPIALGRAGKQLDSIRAFGSVIAHQGNRLFRRFGVREMQIVLLQKIPNIDRLDRPNGFANCQDVWAA